MTHPWPQRSLDEIADQCLGKMLDKAKNRGELRPYLRNINVRWFGFDLRDVKEMRFEASETARYSVQRGDLIICEGGYPGRAAIWDSDDPFYIQKALHRVRFHEPEHAKWFLYYLYFRDLNGTLQQHFSGAGIQHLTGEALRRLRVPIPPLREQTRIVAILDEAFAGIDVAIANTEKNIENAQGLFRDFLRFRFSQIVSKNKYSLQELIDKKWILSHLDGNHGSSYPKKDEFVDSGVAYISAKCIEGNTINFTKSKYLSMQRSGQISKGIAKNRDVIFAHNATVGPVAVLYTPLERVILSTSLTYYRCNENFIHPEYLAHYMRSSDFCSQYEVVMRQSTRNQVPITKQREFYHIIPPIDQQMKIAASLDELSLDIDALTKSYSAT